MPTVALAVDAQEVLGQQRDVVAPLAQGRHAQGDDVEAVVGILAETALFHRRPQILVGGGHQAQVDLLGAAAQALDLTLLQHAQELHLDARTWISSG